MFFGPCRWAASRVQPPRQRSQRGGLHSLRPAALRTVSGGRPCAHLDRGLGSFKAPFAAGAEDGHRKGHIGADELDAIEICHGYVEAQQKYASEDRDRDGMLEYAPRLMSGPGRRDGLFWEGESEPLIPEGLARAEWDGLRKGDAKPYHGYYFRVLGGQGSNAPGGARHYLVKDKMIGGFGLVAWPAEYGVSGIHTFIVNQEGMVYQKDIAPVPGKPPLPITRFDPDPSWERVE